MTSMNGFQKGYFYRDCYFRTSCKEFTIENLSNKYIHLTNDAIQKNSEDYGKFENGNKLSINDFQRYLDSHYAHLSINFMRDIFSQIERLVSDTYRAVYGKIDPSRVKNCFELFGYDFMIDEDFKVYLIEVNTNPCLEISCPLLARIIPEVVDNTFTVAMDPLFQPGQFDTENQIKESFAGAKTFNGSIISGVGVTPANKKRTRRMDLLP
jgi:Tubulin-tyrosine ligase family